VKSPRLSVLGPSVVLALGALSVGCDEQPKSAPAASASAAEAPPVDAKLDSALKAVEQAGDSQAKKPAAGSQPPPSGIFAPGEADLAHRRDAAPKVELLDAGSEPRLALGASARPEKEKTQLLVSLSTGGQQALPPLEITLETTKLEAPKPDAAAKGAEAKAAEPAPAGEARWVTKLSELKIAGDAAVPKQMADTLAKMKGSSLSFTLSPTGPIAFERKLAKDADPALEIALRSIEDTLTSLYVPTPSEAVGEGGYWMVTDRRTALGVDVVRYRVFRVVKVEGDVALLGLDIRQYAADDRVDLPLGPQLAGASLDTYGCAAKGAVDLAPKTLFPSAAQLALRIQAGVAPPGAKAAPAEQRPRAQMLIELVGQLGGEPKSAAMVMAAQGGP